MTLGSNDRLVLFPFGEGFLGGTALSRIQSYPSDSEPDLFLPFEPHDFRRPLPSVAIRLQDPDLRCDRDLGWNIDWAVAFIVDRLEQNWEDAAASLKNIRIRAATLQEKGLSQEIPFRIFNKLDEVLFSGHLKNAVFLDIRSLNSDVSGATYTHRLGPNPNVKRISVILNHDAIGHGQAKETVAIMIHHMIHAYFLVACGGQKEDEVDYGRLDHGVHFGKIILTIKKLSAVHGRELTSLSCGHSSSSMRHVVDEYCSARKREAVAQDDKESWYRSHCHCDVQGPSDGDVDEWYQKICQPMFDQPECIRDLEASVYNDRRHELETRRRTAFVSSAKLVEFMFKEKPILVDGDKIERFLSVMKIFDKAGSRFLKIHNDVSENTFVRFLEFLHTGSYRPDPHLFAAAAVGLGVERRGPPIIKLHATTTEACVLGDVQFAKLGTLMGFEECKSYAMDRMNAYGILYEDPVAVLKEIYGGCEPESDMKAWARKFLTRFPPTSSPGHHTISLNLSTIEPPNLLKLESEQGPHRTRLFDAIDASGALENDVNKARAELTAAGWYSFSSHPPYNMPAYLTDRTLNHLPHAHMFNPNHHSPLLLSDSSPPTPWPTFQNLSSQLSLLELSRLRNLDRERTLDHEGDGDRDHVDKFRDYEHVKSSDRERENLRLRRREVERELKREREKLKRLEKEKEEVREEVSQLKAEAMVEALFGKGDRGAGAGAGAGGKGRGRGAFVGEY